MMFWVVLGLCLWCVVVSMAAWEWRDRSLRVKRLLRLSQLDASAARKREARLTQELTKATCDLASMVAKQEAIGAELTRQTEAEQRKPVRAKSAGDIRRAVDRMNANVLETKDEVTADV